MLKALQIQELVKGGEGYNVDFKRSVPSKVKEISDEVASFANAAGGYVLIGVDNNNQIIGAEIDNNKRSAIQDTIGEISPALRCEFYPVDVEGKRYGSLTFLVVKISHILREVLYTLEKEPIVRNFVLLKRYGHSLLSAPRFFMMPFLVDGLILIKILSLAIYKPLWKWQIFQIHCLSEGYLKVLNS